jgi:hypothetical protein
LPPTGDAERDLRQKLASGFNRNHMINFEGGAIPQEYLTAYIIDRVNTTGTVFLGLTVACAQCHDHKYDPLTQREFYQLYAFFNNVPEAGSTAQRQRAPFSRRPQPSGEFDKARRGRAEQRRPPPSTPHNQPGNGVRQKAAWICSIREFKGKGYADPAGRLVVLPAAERRHLRHGQSLAGTAMRRQPDEHFRPGPGRSVNGNIVLTKWACARSW